MGFVIFIVIVAAAIFLSSNAANAKRQKWQDAARQLNLSFYQGGMGNVGRIAGSMRGHQVSINTFTRGSGSASQTYTRYTLGYREPVDVVFKANTQHMMHSVEKIFGLQDIEVGDSAFDDQILLQGDRPAEIIHFLTPKLREEIRLMAVSYPDITITNNLVTVNKRGTDSDPSSIVHTVRRIANFCDVMTGAAASAGADSVQDAEFGHAETSDFVIEPVEPPYNPLYPSNPTVSEPVWTEVDEEQPVVEVEEPIEVEVPVAEVTSVIEDADMLSDEPPMAEESINQIASVVEEATMVMEDPMKEEANEPAVIEEEPMPLMETTEEPAPPEPVTFESVSLEEAARELFGDSGSALLSSRLFDERFKDRQVTGSGELTRVGKFSYDPVFVNTKGVKATLTVCQLAGSYSKIKVVAEVVYPPEKYDELKSRVGASLPVSGKLISHDAMMHRLFVMAE